jgi:hypothetical protein
MRTVEYDYLTKHALNDLLKLYPDLYDKTFAKEVYNIIAPVVSMRQELLEEGLDDEALLMLKSRILGSSPVADIANRQLHRESKHGWVGVWFDDVLIKHTLNKLVAKACSHLNYKTISKKLGVKAFNNILCKPDFPTYSGLDAESSRFTEKKTLAKTSPYSQAEWSVPISSIWYGTVYKYGIPFTDIAGKTVVVLSAKLLPNNEQVYRATDKAILFRAEVAFAQRVRKGDSTPIDTHISDNTILHDITLEEFQTLNPNFSILHPNILVKENTNKQVYFKTNGKVQYTKINRFKPAIINKTLTRYIAMYEKDLNKKTNNAEESVKRIGSSTTKPRAIAVLRGRSVRTVLKDLGVEAL